MFRALLIRRLGMLKRWALALAVIVLAVTPAAAQPQQDPFNGQFGAISIAPPAPEAARLSKLMGDAINNLAPQRHGRLDVYLVVASFWSEPVFEREATQAEAILRQHFGITPDHSIVLSAGTGGGERSYPAATPENVAAALGQVGSLIDPNEDLVVVFFTSHGSPDGSMAMRETNRMGGALRPTNMRDLLAQAGITRRVVIISSCFSGAFIAPLMDDNTIVLTAAAPDRTSFGCQPSRDWTFFGDAYFGHAISGGADLVSGFDQAKTLIEQWEREQNFTPPSNPQRFIGANAQTLLRRAEQRR